MMASKEARTAERHREQVARLVALVLTEDWSPVTRPLRVGDLVPSILGGSHFDIAAVRAYGEWLITEGERLELERAVFADWTRTQGKGPENRERGAFVSVETDADWVTRDDWEHGRLPADLDEERMAFLRSVFDRATPNPKPEDAAAIAKRGGWPGPLAREWGTVRCEACEGRGRTRGCERCVHGIAPDVDADGRELAGGERCRSCPRCKPCKGRGYVKHPKREAAAANGGAHLIRMGQRLLEAIEGQPSECQACHGLGERYVVHAPDDIDSHECPDCHGTGHNLAGALPAFVFPRETNDAHVLAYHQRRQGRERERRRGAVTRTFAHVQGGESLAITIDRHTAQLIGWDVEEFDRGPLPRAGVD